MPNAMEIPIARRLKNAQRYREVLGVLARYGFATFISKSGFSPLRKANADWLYSRDGTIDLSAAPMEVRLRKAMEELPIQIQQGGADGVASPPDTRRVFEAVGSTDKTYKEYPGLFHEIYFELQRDETVGDLVQWLRAHV